MKPGLFEYAAPTSIEEAVRLRAQCDDTVVLSGGQSLVPTLNFRLSNPDLVVDLRRVPGLTDIAVTDRQVQVGAMVRQRDLELDDHVHRANALIRATLENVAHSVIRNRGTVGGSIAHADSSAELPCLLMALEGTVVAHGQQGRREIAAADLFEFIFTTSLEPSEILTQIDFPVLGPKTGWCFLEFARRHGDFALAGVATTLSLDVEGNVASVRLAACGVSTTPVRLGAVEEQLTGSRATPRAFTQAAALAKDAVNTPDDSAVSQAYRRNLLAGLIDRSLNCSLARASTKEQSR